MSPLSAHAATALGSSPEDWIALTACLQDQAIFTLDLEGRIATWSGGAQAIKGYTADEVVGTHFSRFYPEDEAAAGSPERALEEVRKTGRLVREGWRVRKAGARFWAGVAITALRDAAGAVRGFLKVTRDLSGRRTLEDALRESEQRCALLVELATAHALYGLDLAGRVRVWNAGAERLYGYAAKEVIGEPVGMLWPIPSADTQSAREVLDHALSKGQFDVEGYRARKDGSLFQARTLVRPIVDGRGECLGFGEAVHDLTAAKGRHAESWSSPSRVPAPFVGALSGTRILLVEDDEDSRELLAVVLSEAGATVETADCAATGFSAFGRLRPDVLVSDIGMPEENGYSFMQRIRALGPAQGGDLPAIALTAFTAPQDMARSLAAGFSMHIGKPINLDVLIAAIAKLAATSRGVSASP